DCQGKEYFEFETLFNEAIDIEFFRLNAGSRAKLYIYRNTTADLVIAFDKIIYGPSQSLRVKGGKSVYIIEVEAIRDPSIDQSIRYIVKIDGQRYQSSGVFHTTIGIPTLEDFGSIPKGTPAEEVIGLTVNELFEKRLWKPSPAPNFYPPDISLSPAGKTVEEGSTIEVNFTSNYNRNDAGADYGATLLYQNGVYLGNVPGSYRINIFGRNEFRAKQSYLQGEGFKTSVDGIEWPNTIKAGTVQSSTVVIQGQRGVFFGAIEHIPQSSEEIRQLGLLLDGKKNQRIALNTEWKEQYLVFAYPSTYGKLSLITYEEGLGANVLGTFDNMQIDVADASLANPKKYEVYVTKGVLLYNELVHYNFQF
ncbi:hypothetical protein, partial [Flammeovirga sp. SJP92]|uniref:hypothetical protein n=1 Tax=Flammeovirga sp. SJP92 TaxID=1775430 RepID=UPI000788850A